MYSKPAAFRVELYSMSQQYACEFIFRSICRLSSVRLRSVTDVL